MNRNRNRNRSSSFKWNKKMKLDYLLYLLFAFLFIGNASSDVLQNPDFESPPANLPGNSSAPVQELNDNSTLPGWSFGGTIWYVTSTNDMLLPGNGHAIQLGADGYINQTFKANADYQDYLLTFVLATGGHNCSFYANVTVSAPDTSAVFAWKQKYVDQAWETYGVYLGNFGQQEDVTLEIATETMNFYDNSTCWPIVDNLLLKSIGPLVQGNSNILSNGGFEDGPEFQANSTEGILLEDAPSPVRSALAQWSILGTIKYINSKDYFVPQGNAAVELVSGASTGIQTAYTLTEGSAYSLEFILGDANDSWEGSFVVGAQAGSAVQNFTLPANGSGSAKNLSLAFRAGASVTQISFISYTITMTRDGVLCGPVIDNVVLRASRAMILQAKLEFVPLLLFAVAIL